MTDVYSEIREAISFNGTECKRKIDDQLFYPLALIPASLITLFFAFTRKRRNVLFSVMGGRPGLIIPMDTFTVSHRNSYACAFGATASLVYRIVVEQKLIIPYSGPLYLKSFVIFLSMAVYGFVYFPVFSCLAIGHAVGYGLGTLYIWMLTGVEIYKLTECDMITVERVLFILRELPTLTCLLYLSVSVAIKTVKEIRSRHFFLWNSDVRVIDTLEDIRNSCYGKHVIQLLRPAVVPEPPTPARSTGNMGKVLTFLKMLMKQIGYHRKPGYVYPSRVLSVAFVSVIVVYQCTLEIILGTVMILQADKETFDTALISIESWNIALICYIVGIVIAFVFTLNNILHMLSNFRDNLQELFKGDHSIIPPANAKKYASYCLNYLRYAGFQVGFIVWGFLFQAALLVFIAFVIAIINTAFPYGILQMLEVLWPWILILTFLLIMQRVTSSYVFLQERGKVCALDNRRCFFIFSYFMFFFNMFIGLFFCIIRIVEGICLSLMYLCRLDKSSLPKRYEMYDPGYYAYIGYMQMEYVHTHPVLIVFTKLLLLYGILEMSSVTSSAKRDNKRHLRRRIRFRWHLAYTLLNNPDVKTMRKTPIKENDDVPKSRSPHINRERKHSTTNLRKVGGKTVALETHLQVDSESDGFDLQDVSLS